MQTFQETRFIILRPKVVDNFFLLKEISDKTSQLCNIIHRARIIFTFSCDKSIFDIIMIETFMIFRRPLNAKFLHWLSGRYDSPSKENIVNSDYSE